MMLGVAALLFPKLALGLSGFETGVVVMPLVKGSRSDTEEQPTTGRIRNTRKLLTAAAVIMSFFLITSSFVTILLIPTAEFQSGGKASGRALAYLAHLYLGNGFGTIYISETKPGSYLMPTSVGRRAILFNIYYASSYLEKGILLLSPVKYCVRLNLIPSSVLLFMLQVKKNCLVYQLKLLPKQMAGIYVRAAFRRRGVAKRDRT